MNRDQIQNALSAHGLSGTSVAVHSSLKSFGHVDGGAESVIAALTSVCRNVMMPAFCEVGRTNPPLNDRPRQNGWDYEAYSIEAETGLFDPETFGVRSEVDVAEMGVIPASLLETAGVVRSAHPSVSWCCSGPDAAWLMADHSPDNPNLPLKRLIQIGGHVLLLGVDLTACTAMHLAEEVAGRRPFIRWVKYSDGSTRRVREYGCSGGFEKLRGDLSGQLQTFMIGPCQVVVAKLSDLVSASAELIRRDPERTICASARSCRCQDAAKGGPIS